MDKRCLICSCDDNLEAHHIISLDVIWELRNDELNIIILCKRCHHDAHNTVYSPAYLIKLIKRTMNNGPFYYA